MNDVHDRLKKMEELGQVYPGIIQILTFDELRKFVQTLEKIGLYNKFRDLFRCEL